MSQQNKKTLNLSDFEEVFQDKLSARLASKIKECRFDYEEMTGVEHDQWVLRIVKTLLEPNLVRAGGHRLNQWESGWSENLEAFSRTKDKESLVPRYFGKYNAVRWKQRFIKPLVPDFEKNTLGIILGWLFEKYFKEATSVYEFGCGTGFNLLRLLEVNDKAKIYGLDWAAASKNIIAKMVEFGLGKNMKGFRFDLFNPDYSLKLDQGSSVYTVAALEQTGDKFGKFVDYLIENKPKICVHIEPIGELLSQDNLLDYLSVEYFKKRNYLSGFLNHLRELEKADKIKIHLAQRTYIGSLFVDGYSVVVWSPNVKSLKK